MDAVREQFERFIRDDDRYAKWCGFINGDNRCIGRLRWWQERVWESFIQEHPQFCMMSFAEICDAFGVCSAHGNRLKPVTDCSLRLQSLPKDKDSCPYPAVNNYCHFACETCTLEHLSTSCDSPELMVLFFHAFSAFLVQEAEHATSGINERTLCGQLAMFLNFNVKASEYSRYYVDVEYNRKQNGQIKTLIDHKVEVIAINCDLIVHSRGELVADDNLIAVEMKKAYHPESEKQKDRERLRALTKNTYDVFTPDPPSHPEHVCGYRIGIYLELDAPARLWHFELYEHGQLATKWDHAF